jgi:hypothetical protein
MGPHQLSTDLQSLPNAVLFHGEPKPETDVRSRGNGCSPFYQVVGAAEARWQCLEVRQRVFDRKHGKLALKVECGLELPCRQQQPVHAPHAVPWDLGEDTRTAFSTGRPWSCLERPGAWIAPRDFDGISRVHRDRNIRCAVYRLTVVAVTEELGHWLAAELDLNSTATALDHHHSAPHKQLQRGSSGLQLHFGDALAELDALGGGAP